jgi:hypothetical protein
MMVTSKICRLFIWSPEILKPIALSSPCTY